MKINDDTYSPVLKTTRLIIRRLFGDNPIFTIYSVFSFVLSKQGDLGELNSRY